MQLLHRTQLLAFERHLDAACQTVLDDLQSSLLAERLRQTVAGGGKRIRPQLVLWTYAHAQENDDDVPAAVLDVAAAWELFHAFLLIHDDIIDGSDCRRGRPSLHRQLQSLDSDSPRFGANLGIVAGDLLFAAANRLLADLDVSGDAYRAIHRLFARVATVTGVGQAMDVLQSHASLAGRDEETLLREYHWKTAAYTFEGPMLSAAVLAGLPQSNHDAISRYALCLGQAYQMQNDLLDLVRPVAEGSDLVEGKHTYTLLKAREHLAGSDRQLFDRDFAKVVASEGRAIPLAESLRQRLLETPALAATHARIDQLLGGCLCDDADLPPRLRHAMAGCLDELRRRYFVEPVVA